MQRFLKFLIVAPIAIVLVVFAFANRQGVTVSLDPFESGDRVTFSFDAPLFVVIIGATIMGVIVGGITVWFGQGRHRRSARQWRTEAERLKSDLDAVRAQAPLTPSAAFVRRA